MTIFAVNPQHESSCVGVVVPTIVSRSNVATVFAVAAAAATPTFVFMSLSILSSLSYTTSVTKQVLAAVTTKLTNRNGLFLLIYCLFFYGPINKVISPKIIYCSKIWIKFCIWRYYFS